MKKKKKMKLLLLLLGPPVGAGGGASGVAHLNYFITVVGVEPTLASI